MEHKGEYMSVIDEVDAEMGKRIRRKIPNMEIYDFDSEETDHIYSLAGMDLLTVSQLRALVLLMSQKILKDLKDQEFMEGEGSNMV